MRRIAVYVGVLVAILVVADAGLRILAENRAADQIETSLELGEVDVSLGGWPFIVQLFRGQFPSVTVSAQSVGTGELKLSEVELELRHVRVFLLSDNRSVRARSGSGTAVISAEALNSALERAGVAAEVEMSGDGVDVVANGSKITARPSIEGGDLVVGPSVILGLPEFAAGIDYRSVRVVESLMVVSFDLTAGELTLP
ncbi:MAG: LmeA family phospholipid-binding protein [Actinomycetota bacterium]